MSGSICFTEFRKLRPDQLRKLKSVEVTFNSEYLFTFLNPQTGHIREQAQYWAELSNGVGGLSLEEINAGENQEG